MPDNEKTFDKEKLENELNKIQAETEKEISKSENEFSEKLRRLLEGDIVEKNKKEKTRGAEMLTIFAAHNFYANGLTPVEMRTTLEDLGPTYVKIGQIISSRPDMLPENYCKELEKLRQNVKPLDPEIAKAVIENEIGKPIDEIFSEFNDKPLGSASIGQAHSAVMKDGTKVVVKVQRPLIEEMMNKDFVLLKKLAGLVNVVSDEDEGDQMIDLVSVIEELEKVSNEELDFRIEAENTKFFKENCIEDEEKISCPTVIDELTTKRIFTMTFVDGYTVSHTEKMQEEGLDVLNIGHAITENFIHQVFDVGTFHADPHQGNIMISNGKPYWIDFGMVGRITEKDIDCFQKIVISLLAADTEGVVDGILQMGASSPKTNRDKLIEDADLFISKIANAKSINDIDISDLFNEITDLASKHHISLPGEYTMLARAIIAIEGVIEQLCPELNLFELLSDKMKERMKNAFDIKQTLLDIGKDLYNSGKKTSKIPVLLADTLTSMSKGKLKMNFELSGTEEPMDRLAKYVQYIVLIVVACVLFLGCCLLSMVDIQPKTQNGMPLIALIGIVFSIALAIFSIGKLFRK